MMKEKNTKVNNKPRKLQKKTGKGKALIKKKILKKNYKEKTQSKSRKKIVK